MPGGLQMKAAAKIVEKVIGKPTSSYGADKPIVQRERFSTPPSRNSDRARMRPDDSSVGIRLW